MGYIFIGWDIDFDNVTSNLTVTAQYSSEVDYKNENDITVSITVNPNTISDFHTHQDRISVSGAGFNANPGETISLTFTKPDNDVSVDGSIYNVGNAVQVNISLVDENDNKISGQLLYPVTITVPIPSRFINNNMDRLDDFWILHYHSDGITYEPIKPTVNRNDLTCTFTVTHFSVFVFVDAIEQSNNNNNNNRSSSSGGGGGGSVAQTSQPNHSFDGGTSTFTQGSGSDLTLTIQKDFSLFSNVRVNDTTITRDTHYKAESGSTKITLLSAYLETLNTGQHTLAVRFTDGVTVTENFTVREPQAIIPISETVTSRIAGATRIDTAIAISKEGWQEKADTVVLAYAYSFPDALSATPLAYKNNAPILLSDREAIAPAVLAEIQRLSPSKIILVGGTAVLSSNIENTLRQNYEVIRYAGIDRFATATQIAVAVGSTGTAVIVNGEAYQDALAISSFSANQGIPILFTGRNNLPATTAEAIRNMGITKTIVIGGTGVISGEVVNQLPSPTRYAGYDCYETATVVANAVDLNMNIEKVYVVTGSNFADALVAGNLAARTLSPLIMTEPNAILPVATQNFFQTNKDKINSFTVVGGTAVIPESQVNAIKNIID